MQKNKVFLLFSYATKIAKERGFGKGRFFFLKSLLFPNQATNWVSFIDNFYKNNGFENAPWDVVATPLRLCLSNHLNATNRTKSLQNHFEILQEKFSQKTINNLLSEKNVKLATIAGKTGNEYEFSIAYALRWRREGMLTVFLTDKSQDDLILTTLTFSFSKNPAGENIMLIGGLQGPMTELGRETIVKATRDMNGLRPKHAVLECAYAIADFFDVKEIVATSINNHPIRLTNKRRKRDFFADYDVFWQELGGVLNENKNFNLPRILVKRKLEDVPSKKKKDWLARHAHIEAMKKAATENLGNC